MNHHIFILILPKSYMNKFAEEKLPVVGKDIYSAEKFIFGNLFVLKLHNNLYYTSEF